MARFLIYLFESGLCLSLFYMGYIIFFRKETYFTFNRFYLLGSMILALTVPLISIPIDWGNGGYLHDTANGVKQIKDYYEHLILLTDPGSIATGQSTSVTDSSAAMTSSQYWWSGLNLTSILVVIYSLGVLFFSFRLLYLLRELKKLRTRAIMRKEEGITLVLIKEELPSFSFLKWIFINPYILKPEEYEQVLTHEKVHVEHKHSVDLLLAHLITIFQWFNPLTWRIQKSIKTCHEYIADRQVVSQGHGLFDYQSLLLSQLISIRSVELVNNFNLLSIKKRIAMMNKNKSGRWARMKAFAIVPILIAAFFLFADMTSRNENLSFKVKTSIDTRGIVGSWIAHETGKDRIQIVEIKPDKLVAITPKGNNAVEVKEYVMDIEDGMLMLSSDKEVLELGYKYESNLLTIDWGEGAELNYSRNDKDDSYTILGDQFEKLNLPDATQAKVYKIEMILCSISLSNGKLFVDNKACDFNKLQSLMEDIRANAERTKVDKMTVLLNIDKDAQMKDVDKIKNALRNSNNLKLGYLAKSGNAKSATNKALFNLLPPMDAQWLEEDELNAKGISLFKIGKSFEDFSHKLVNHIRNNKKYVMLYEYDNRTTYNDYIQTLDLVYKTINELRRDAAANENKEFDMLSYEQQKEYRKRYPITLTQKNTDTE